MLATILNGIILLLIIFTVAWMFQIWRFVKGIGRLLLVIAFSYLAAIRVTVFLGSIFGFPITLYWSLPFYVLLAAGVGILLREIRKTLEETNKGGRNGK